MHGSIVFLADAVVPFMDQHRISSLSPPRIYDEACWERAVITMRGIVEVDRKFQRQLCQFRSQWQLDLLKKKLCKGCGLMSVCKNMSVKT